MCPNYTCAMHQYSATVFDRFLEITSTIHCVICSTLCSCIATDGYYNCCIMHEFIFSVHIIKFYNNQ